MVKNVARIPTIRRLPLYLRLLKARRGRGETTVSTSDLAEKLALDQVVVRKDLTITGVEGKPRVGFDLEALISGIEHFLGWDNVTDAFVIGAGHLGGALMGYGGFSGYGLNIVSAFDTDPVKIGAEIYGKPVFPLYRLPELVERMHVHMGILTVPVAVAQETTDFLVDSGVRGIWNFTPACLHVPDNVAVQKEDLASGLAVLSVKLAEILGRPEEKAGEEAT